MALVIECNGHVKASELYLSAYVSIMQSEFDHELKWPFRDTIFIQLLNQKKTEQRHSRCLSFNNASEDASSRVIEGESKTGWGIPHFITQKDLQNYLNNDSLCFRVSYIPKFFTL